MRQKSIRIVNGYRLIYKPEHRAAMNSKNWKGYVYEHIVIAEKSLGRNISKNEDVHHLDGNRSNNRSENLIVIEKSQHRKIEEWLKKGAPSEKSEGANRMNSGKSKVNKSLFCKICSKTLQNQQKTTCSKECCLLIREIKSKRPPKKVLENLIQNNSFVAIGQMFEVSDNAVRKWARKYNLL